MTNSDQIKERIEFLYERYTNATATKAELAEFLEYAADPVNESVFESLMSGSFDDLYEKSQELEAAKLAPVHSIAPEKGRRIAPEKSRRAPYKWIATAAAAAVLLFFGISHFLKLQNNQQQSLPPAQPVATTHDVSAPAIAHASIKLATGQILVLDTASAGTIATQGNTQIIKTTQGSITYNADQNQIHSAVLYNELVNPRGSRVVSISLSDGTKVWLNAGSSLKYPSAFTGNERKVEITGEAYFEVAHNAAKPFKVTKNNLEVAVLGTHFNVSTYDDDPSIKVTLLEGSVKIINNKNIDGNDKSSAMLKPGEQATINAQNLNDKISVSKNVDVDEVMAWKNNRFDFGDKATIETVMRQVSRWYDVDISYQGTIKNHFGGSISRDANVSEVMKILEASGGIRYAIEGRKLR